MTIDDQIRDEKLQYDINGEAAKISVWSSDKIDKYEYLNGKETLKSNQKQIIEQVKFTYYSLGKAFEKKTTTEDQGKKHVKSLEDLKPKELEAIEDKSDNNKKHLKYKEVFNELSRERMDEIYKICKEIDFVNLTYHFKGPNLQ